MLKELEFYILLYQLSILQAFKLSVIIKNNSYSHFF